MSVYLSFPLFIQPTCTLPVTSSVILSSTPHLVCHVKLSSLPLCHYPPACFVFCPQPSFLHFVTCLLPAQPSANCASTPIHLFSIQKITSPFVINNLIELSLPESVFRFWVLTIIWHNRTIWPLLTQQTPIQFIKFSLGKVYYGTA